MTRKKIKVALSGNPNSGKTTVFNAITGAHQHVGNYPGVTVEKKSGTRRFQNHELEVVDLPGVYSLTPHSLEEEVARNFLVEEKPDVVIDIIDSSNLERNLYLAVQLMEMGVPLVLAFNMSDVSASRGVRFDLDQISQLFGVPIVSTVGHRNKGIEELLSTSVKTALESNGNRTTSISYGKEIDRELQKLQEIVVSENGTFSGHHRRWLAIKLLEGDSEVLNLAGNQNLRNAAGLHKEVEQSKNRLESIMGDHPEILIADQRYGYISGVLKETVSSTIEQRKTTSDKIDSVVTNRVLGLPLFLGLMYAVFHLTFTVGDPMMGWIEELFGWLGGTVESWWPVGSDSALRSLLLDGIICGVGGVVVFLPNILLLFLAIAILEDSGYMARTAFIMDRLMHKIGLHGKSFIPMLIGFGCTIPAIMATRTLENRRDRLTTMMVAPLMSCGARLPIYALIIPAFFPQMWHGAMLWTIYVIGILLAIVSAKLLRSTVFKGKSTPFVMELPPYRMPTLKGVLIHMWGRGWLYLKKAGTIILGVSIVLWALTSYPQKVVFDQDYEAASTQATTEYEVAVQMPNAEPEIAQAILDEKLESLAQVQQAEEMAYTVAGRIGHWLEPIISPMGFDWRIGTALIGSFAAKEVFVAQMGIVYAVGEADEESDALRGKLAANYSPLVAFCIMLFTLISAPCMATIAITKRESNSWKWALFQLGGLTALAWVVTVATFQLGSLFGIGI
ncbi:MAG: ferrous iron transport protein B [candidate division Zixibacteria bacterium HGW-Zixibacteria-1]|nr:MAG: ferrous iron transport protein B [candidate division Zixibacteria bacterium HGW-Zixibacteria-1]